MRKTMIVGNWKMQGSSLKNEQLVNQLIDGVAVSAWAKSIDIVVCPPFVYLDQVGQLLTSSSIQLGAQDVSAYKEGAYTGQIAADMLLEKQCQWVIIGHSERRQFCGESDVLVAKKVRQAIESGLKPILCLGETQGERAAAQTEAVVAMQMRAVLSEVGTEAFANVVVAYEPIWAIGTGLTAMPAEAQAVHQFLRETVAQYDEGLAKKVRILYGGSVKPENAAGLFKMPDIDGALVGGAALNADSFLGICAAQSNK